MLHQLLRKLRHSNWPETMATVESCRYVNLNENPVTAVPEGGPMVYYSIAFHYTVNGEKYEGGLMAEAEVQKGDRFPICYNPAHPERNSSEPYGDWEKYYDGVFVLVLVGFVFWFYLTHKG